MILRPFFGNTSVIEILQFYRKQQKISEVLHVSWNARIIHPQRPKVTLIVGESQPSWPKTCNNHNGLGIWVAILFEGPRTVNVPRRFRLSYLLSLLWLLRYYLLDCFLWLLSHVQPRFWPPISGAQDSPLYRKTLSLRLWYVKSLWEEPELNFLSSWCLHIPNQSIASSTECVQASPHTFQLTFNIRKETSWLSNLNNFGIITLTLLMDLGYMIL